MSKKIVLTIALVALGSFAWFSSASAQSSNSSFIQSILNQLAAALSGNSQLAQVRDIGPNPGSTCGRTPMPAGQTYQTVVCLDGQWQATSALQINGLTTQNNVGIGTTPGVNKLTVQGTTNTTNLVATEQVFTPSLCLSGDCKSAWPTGGGGSLPSGTANQTLRYDAQNQLVSTNAILTNGVRVGIGTTPTIPPGPIGNSATLHVAAIPNGGSDYAVYAEGAVVATGLNPIRGENTIDYPANNVYGFGVSGVTLTNATSGIIEYPFGGGVGGFANGSRNAAVFAKQDSTGFGFYQGGSTNSKNYFQSPLGIGTTNPAERLDLGGGNIKMGHQFVKVTSTNSLFAQATCPLGKYVVGGGCVSDNPQQNLRTSAPGNSAEWRCTWNGEPLGVVSATAICANIR